MKTLDTNLNKENKFQDLSLIEILNLETINGQGNSNETLIEIIIEMVVTAIIINLILVTPLTQFFSTLSLIQSINSFS